MAITCPACNKANQTESLCARCGCELTNLYRVAMAASDALLHARRCLYARDWQGALVQAERSWSLCHSVEAARMAFLATSALGATQPALTWYARASAVAA